MSGAIKPYRHHIFICTNERKPDDPRGSCRGDAIRARFREVLDKHGVSKKDVRPNNCGCLDKCALGPTVVVYPEGVWYGRVTLDDVEEIVASHIVGGIPVERLRIDRAKE